MAECNAGRRAVTMLAWMEWRLQFNHLVSHRLTATMFRPRLLVAPSWTNSLAGSVGQQDGNRPRLACMVCFTARGIQQCMHGQEVTPWVECHNTDPKLCSWRTACSRLIPARLRNVGLGALHHVSAARLCKNQAHARAAADAKPAPGGLDGWNLDRSREKR